MLVSGFLMFWNIESRFKRENPYVAGTWKKFFARRFFRIAPLYFLALVVSMVLEDYFKTELRAIYLTQGAEFTRPFEACHREAIANVFLHVSFLFGFHPCYAASNVIPDWSLSLEMQFYLCFPLLYFAFKRWSAIPLVLVAAVCVGISLQNISVYTIDPSKWMSFPQPSILILRLNCFVAGIVLAKIVCSERASVMDFIALMLSVFLFQRLTFAVIACFLTAVILRQLISNRIGSKLIDSVLDRSATLFEAPFFRRLGDLSYGVYLVHIFLLIPAVRFLQSTTWFLQLGGASRFILVAGVVIPLALLLAKIAFEAIEKPFINVGRKVASRLA